MFLLEKLHVRAIFCIAALLRLILISVAEVQDLLAEVPYTDVDYQVFSDAAGSVALGISPYAGRTPLLEAEATRYRYTPMLAFLLLPNIWVHPVWGKLLFSALDLAAAWLLRRWLEVYAPGDAGTLHIGLCLWLFNPFCFTISTRGSGESVVVLLLYGCFTALYMRQNVCLAAILFGIATHWRVYPIVYALPIVLNLAGADRRGVWCLLHWQAVVLGIIAGGTFLFLAALFYSLYGWTFLQESYFYHGQRLDPQHNFSVYFYPTALHVEDSTGSFPNLARYAVLPQLALCVFFGWRHACSGLAVAPLLQTLALVATNKVLTAQYFVWWWSLLPLALPWLEWRRWALWRSLLWWAASEIHWLLWAYFLEFRKWPVRPFVWAASCMFLAAHMSILRELIRCAKAEKAD